MSARHKRPCILCCVDNQQNSMVHASVWHTCQCIHVSVYVLSTFTKLCNQKAQWVSNITSTDTYMQTMSTDKYMHVSRPSNCVYMQVWRPLLASTDMYACKYWKPWVRTSSRTSAFVHINLRLRVSLKTFTKLCAQSTDASKHRRPWVNILYG